MLNEEKVDKVIELIQRSSLTSDKQREWFIRLCDMKCEGKTDECIYQFIKEILEELDVLSVNKKDQDELEQTIVNMENERISLEYRFEELLEEKSDLESELENKNEEITNLLDDIDRLKAELMGDDYGCD